jgi:hypothetical protein
MSKDEGSSYDTPSDAVSDQDGHEVRSQITADYNWLSPCLLICQWHAMTHSHRRHESGRKAQANPLVVPQSRQRHFLHQATKLCIEQVARLRVASASIGRIFKDHQRP